MTTTVPIGLLGFSPDTGTREMPAFRRGVPLDVQPTEELHVLDLRPPVTALPRRRPRVLRYGWLVGLLAGGVVMQLAEAVTR